MSSRSRLSIAALHLGICAVVSAVVALVIFTRWYPSPFQAATGATELFMLVVGIDVLLGPLLTSVVASPAKPRRELARDLTVIALLQLGALGYGLYTVALARPVALVFEVDQFRLLSAADIEIAALNDAPVVLRNLSWSGPKSISVVKPSVAAEQLRVIDLELAGIPLAAMPRYWREYSAHTSEVWRIARPVAVLLAKYPGAASEVESIARRASRPGEELRFLPLRVRRGEWVTLISGPAAQIVGHLPLDGFF
jgi:hypothetical protein